MRLPLFQVFLFSLAPLWADPPVFFTSSHIGSFFAFAHLLPSDSGVTLVQVDAHDDAMALTESRSIRQRLWKTGLVQEPVLRTLDAGQYIEGYNWIEPLMPNPLAALVWVAPPNRIDGETLARVTESLNTEVRRVGHPALSLSIVEGPAWEPPPGPWVLSIDLDYFSDDPDSLESTLREMLHHCLEHPPLVVTFAVSQPYQPSNAATEVMVLSAWRAILEETSWSVAVDPRVDWGGRDRGQERRLAAQGRIWQEFDFEKVRPWADDRAQGRIVYGSGKPN